MEHFAKIVNSFQALPIFAKRSILDAWQDSEYISVIHNIYLQLLTRRIENRKFNSLHIQQDSEAGTRDVL